jgi:hypothetical protein
MRTMLAALCLLFCTAIAVSARQPDNPCPTCCAQLKQFRATQKSIGDAGIQKEADQAAIAGHPGDPVAEVHCAYLLKKLKAEVKG